MKRLFFLILVVFLLTGKVFAENLIELQFEVNSSEIYFGDTLYIAVYAKNISGKRLDNFPAFNLGYDFLYNKFYKHFKVYLTQIDADVSFPFYQMCHSDFLHNRKVLYAPVSSRSLSSYENLIHKSEVQYRYVSLEKDAKILIHVLEFPMPSLDDINDKFWSRLLNDSAQDKNKNKFILHIKGKIKENDISYFDGEINRELTIKPRSKKTMFLIEYWHSTFPPNAFIISSRYPSLKFLSDDYKNNKNYTEYPVEYKLRALWKSDKIILVSLSDFRYSLWSYYPPHYCSPSTWEGWEKLEGIFEEGTLRDEIRYTRLCLQYFETKDDGVLDELKKLIAKFDKVRQDAIVEQAKRQAINFQEHITLKKLFDAIQNFQP
ncbi:MAG: hypothetical protein LBC74_11270 [Planctomycetaceae bacterium]|jgi:hypothetical protein|nr:hypothetical protein [Planctomycetaceae bacterium]